CMQALDFPLTC
nr:immunoglobulin light chain junction region [Macaca mulatta]